MNDALNGSFQVPGTSLLLDMIQRAGKALATWEGVESHVKYIRAVCICRRKYLDEAQLDRGSHTEYE